MSHRRSRLQFYCHQKVISQNFDPMNLSQTKSRSALRSISRLRLLWWGLIFLLSAQSALADVGGTRQTLYRQHQLFGGAVMTGNTLMNASLADPLVNSRLLSSSPGDVEGVPFDAQIEGAYLFWSGSTLNTRDNNADLTLPNGTVFNDVTAQRCFTLNAFGGFYYCRADVTQLIQANPGSRRFNGQYTVGDIRAEPGTLDGNGNCVEPQECQAKYAAWSLILVYSSESSSTLRDVSIYDGFLQLDETSTSPGVDSFSISGFDFPQDGEASLSLFGMEGDALLGVPPQDTDSNFNLRCSTCFDFFEVNGQKLQDANNPQNNLFNSSSVVGYTLGVDLDTFNISSALTQGESTLRIRVGSGDGRVNPTRPDPGGGGELFLLGYVMVVVDRNAPNFNRSGTSLVAIPDEASPLERVVFSLSIDNEGSLSAVDVIARLTLPTGLTYLPGSLRVDGVDPIPGEEVNNPLATGLRLGVIPFQGDSNRLITFRASIDEGVTAGSRLTVNATVSARNVMDPTELTEIVTVLGAPPLGQPTKEVIDQDGDDRFSPSDFIQYRITIPNENSRDLNGVQLIDQLPPYLDILQVLSDGGDDVSELAINRVEIEQLSIPSRGSRVVQIFCQIHDINQLIADGVSADEIDGLIIENQATTQLGNDRRLSDDPSTSASADPTAFTLDVNIEIRGTGTRKEVIDLNGAPLAPGDQVRYTLRIRNTGDRGGVVNIDDPFPNGLTDCAIDDTSQGLISCEAGRIQGAVTVEADDIVRLSFTARVALDAPNGQIIQNIAELSVQGEPEQRVSIASPQLQVVATPELVVTKSALGGSDVAQGGTLSYAMEIRNEGNRVATAVRVVDLISFPFTALRPSGGGQVNDGQVVWALGDINPGGSQSVSLEVDIDPSIRGGARLSNQLQVEVDEFDRPVLSDDPATADVDDPTVVIVTGVGPQLSLVKDVSNRAPRAEVPLIYTLTLTNSGDAPLTNVTVQDRMQSGTFNSFSAPQAQSLGRLLVFSPATEPALTSIPPGGEVRLTIDTTLNRLAVGRRISNQASVTADGDLSAVSDDPLTAALDDATVVFIQPTPRLSLNKEVEDLNGGSVEPGDILRYTLSTQALDGAVNGVEITDIVPDALINLNPLDGGRVSGTQLSWRVGALNLNGRSTARFEAEVAGGLPDGTVISNQALIRALEIEGETLSDDPSTVALADPTRVTVRSFPNLSTSIKTVSPAEAAPGQAVEWTLEISNTGRGVARGVLVRDPISEWLVSPQALGGQVQGGVAEWNLGDLAPSQSRRLTLRTTLRGDVSPAQLIANQASITANEGEVESLTDDPATAATDDPTTLTILPGPDLVLTKSFEGDERRVRAGAVVQYVIRVLNPRVADAQNIVITDTLSPQLGEVVSADGGVVRGDEVTWLIPRLEAGEERRFRLDVRIVDGALPGDLITNQADVSAQGLTSIISDDPNTLDPDDPTVIQVVGDVQLDLTKSVEALDPLPFRSGGRVRYRISAVNQGQEIASSVSVLDPLPDGLIEIDDLSDTPGQQTPNGWSWPVVDLAAGERLDYLLEARISPQIEANTLISNQASISYEGASNPFLSDDPNTPERDATRFIVQAGASVRLEKRVRSLDDSGRFIAGGALQYEITASNDGPGESDALSVTDALSPSLNDVEASVSSGMSDGVTAQLNGRVAQWLIPSLRVGQQVTLLVSATLNSALDEGEVILNQAEVALVSTPDQPLAQSDDPSTPAPQDPTALTIRGRGRLTLTKALLEGGGGPGDSITYTLTLSNSGELPLREVSLTDTLPAPLTVQSVRPAAQAQGRTLTWSEITLEPQERRVFTINARVGEGAAIGTTVRNQATASSPSSAPTVSDDPSTPAPDDPTIFVVQRGAQLSLSKTLLDVDGGGLFPGDLVEFTITVGWEGEGAVSQIEVVDPISPLLEEVEAVGGQLSAGVARWSIAQLQPSASRSFTLRGRVRGDASEGDLLTNQFAARLPEEDFVLSSEVTATVTTQSLSLQKEARALSGDAFVAGGLIEYTLTLTNRGANGVNGASIFDPIDETRLSEVVPLSGGVLQGGIISWDATSIDALNRIPPGGEVTVGFQARLIEGLNVGDRVSNQAFVRVGAGLEEPSDDPQTPEPNDPTRVTISDGAQLVFLKSISEPARDEITAGGTLTYEITLENRGTASSGPLTVEDLLDPRLSPLSLTVDGRSRDPQELTNFGLFVDSIPPRGRVLIELQVRVSERLEDREMVANQATATLNQSQVTLESDDPLTPETGDPTTFTLGAEALINVEKTATTESGRATAQVDEIITWDVTVTNEGIGAAYDLLLEDLISPNSTYLSGSMSLDGLLLTDAPDGDFGEATSDLLSVRIPTLNAGQRRSLVFQTRVARGPQVINQAVLNYGRDRILSDNNSSREDGINPTRIEVEEVALKGYEVRLELTDPNGPPARIAEPLDVTFVIANTGSAPLDDLDFAVELPQGLLFTGATAERAPTPPRFVLTPPPASGALPPTTGTLFVDALSLPVGDSITVNATLSIDPDLQENTTLCVRGALTDLTHSVDVDPGDGVSLSPRECVEGTLVFGRLGGRVYQDLNTDDVFTEEKDLTFEGMIVSAWRQGRGEGAPLATDFTSAEGEYTLGNLRPGSYEIRLKSAEGVLYRKVDQVEVVALEETKLPLTVEPSGRVYLSTDGALIDGAELFLYRDEDIDDDPYDDASWDQRTLVPEDELESPTQQGQRSAQGGMYRFGVTRPGRYLIEVIPPGVRYVSPSALAPPTPTFMSVSSGDLISSAEALPSVEPDADRRYFMAFEVQREGTEAERLLNNHIPLDPLSALIQVDKRSRRVQYRLGEIVTYEVDVINRSPVDLLYNQRSKTGGVYLEDALPKGLKYIASSAVWTALKAGREAPLYTGEPTGARLLKFGRVERSGERDVQRPVNLPAGAHLRLRYQAVIGADAKPMKTYTNRATLITEGNVPISAVAKAEIRVIADPDFDQGLMVGRVWCDTNRDGHQTENELGVMGARVYLDNGTYAITDSAGKYHFKQIDPGVHAVKIDTDTLLPKATLTTDELRVIFFTRGLPAKVDFGVTCPSVEKRDPEVELGEETLRAALSALGQKAVILQGDASSLTLEVESLTFKAPEIKVTLMANFIREGVPDLQPIKAGAPVPPLAFKVEGISAPVAQPSRPPRPAESLASSSSPEKPTAPPPTPASSVDDDFVELTEDGVIPIEQSAPAPTPRSVEKRRAGLKSKKTPKTQAGAVDQSELKDAQKSGGARLKNKTPPAQVFTPSSPRRWTLWVSPFGDEERPALIGEGTPPDRIEWSGTDLLGRSLITRGQIITYRLEVAYDDALVSSPVGHFGVGVTLPPEPEILLTYNTDPFVSTPDQAKKESGARRRAPSRAKAEPRGDQLSRKDSQKLREVIARLKRGYQGLLIVEVHGAGERGAEALTLARAQAIARVLKSALKLKADQLSVIGRGNQVPLAPNLTRANRRRNRRVQIRLEQTEPNPEAVAQISRAFTFPMIARAGQEERRPEDSGRFVMVTSIPASGVIEAHLRAVDGRAATFSVPLKAVESSTQRSTRPITVGGTLGGRLSLAGTPLDFERTRLTLSTSKTSKRDAPIQLKIDGDRALTTAWRLLIKDQSGALIHQAKGEDAPPASLEWRPKGTLKSPLTLQLLYELKGGSAKSNQLILTLSDATLSDATLTSSAPPAGRWSLSLNGRAVAPDPTGRVEMSLLVGADESVQVVLTRPDGSYLESMIAPPTSKAQEETPQESPKEALKIPLEFTKFNPLWAGGGSAWNARLHGARAPLKLNLSLPSDAISASSPALKSPQKDPQVTKTSSDSPDGPHAKPQESTLGALNRFGALELLKATTPLLRANAPAVAAQELTARFPEGEMLTSPTVQISGATRPGNRVFLNQTEIPVDAKGGFKGSALIGDDGVLEVSALDRDGNRSRLTRTYTLSDSAWFLLALGEGLSGSLENELDGVHAHTSTQVGDQLYVHGRAVMYLKGRVKGEKILGGLFKRYDVTAHVDTAKRQTFETYFRQMVDPETFYPVYGDSAQEINDVNSRGPIYVLVKADRSLVQAGNFRTKIRGIELINYDRALYGAQVSLDLTSGALRHELKVFGATQDQPERHAYVELRGTGGSLYYLPHRELVEGSERVYIVERDKITNMERRRTPLARNIDYSIRYGDGRLLMMKPVTTSNLDTVGALPQPYGSQSTLDGHQLFVSVEYDHRDQSERGEDAWGVYARETWKDTISIGGGFIQEQQGDIGSGHYRLWGGEFKLKAGRRSGLALEYAESQNQNGETLFSQDGGLTFQPFNQRDGQDARGQSFLVRGGMELDDLIGKGDRDQLYIEGYWRYASPGFYAGGNIQQQGSENYGISSQYWLDERHSFKLQYDVMTTEQTSLEARPFMQQFKREVIRLSHRYTQERLTLESAWTQTAARDAQGIPTGPLGADPALSNTAPTSAQLGGASGQVPSYITDALSTSAQYRLNTMVTLLGEQEVILRGDSRLFKESPDLFVTSFGARFRVSEMLQIEAIESLRWSGDNATQIGVRSELSEGRTVYSQQRFVDQFGQETFTSVVGAEERWGKGARVFSEYQLESGQLGQRNRAVLGVGKRTQVIPGLTLDANYQRSQIFLAGQVSGGALSQDALSLGLEWLNSDRLKASSRLELRFDDQDEWLGRRDQEQLLALNSVSYQVHPDLTFLMRFNYSHTEDLLFSDTSAEFMEGSFGAAYRPIHHRWLAILLKVAKRYEQRPTDLSLERPEKEEMDVISLTPIFELPWHLQLVEKVAYKRSSLSVATLPNAVSHSVLWINRLNYHLTNTWDIGGEYRFLQNTLAQNLMHGALFEVNYIIKRAVRVGAGYNFTSFSDQEFERFDETFGGPFFRVMAHY